MGFLSGFGFVKSLIGLIVAEAPAIENTPDGSLGRRLDEDRELRPAELTGGGVRRVAVDHVEAAVAPEADAKRRASADPARSCVGHSCQRDGDGSGLRIGWLHRVQVSNRNDSRPRRKFEVEPEIVWKVHGRSGGGGI